MTGREHYLAAEGCLRSGDVARAQVHASLAQAEAQNAYANALTVCANAWLDATAPKRQRWFILNLLQSMVVDAEWKRR